MRRVPHWNAMNQLIVGRQCCIATLVDRGWSAREIARELGIHRATVGCYVWLRQNYTYLAIARLLLAFFTTGTLMLAGLSITAPTLSAHTSSAFSQESSARSGDTRAAGAASPTRMIQPLNSFRTSVLRAE